MAQTMNRLILHHSAGTHTPSSSDKTHYHRIVDGSGQVISGYHPIRANAIGQKLVSGKYAAHTLNLNGGSIGLAMACMHEASWSNPRACRYFPTSLQIASMIAEAARLCAEYNIVIDRQHVLSHAEVQQTLGVAQRGKWDFDYDPFGVLDSRDPIKVGDLIREKIWEASSNKPAVVQPPVERRVIRRGSVGSDVRLAQQLLTSAGFNTQGTDGIFGPDTEKATINFQRSRQLWPDAVIGSATWSALEKKK